MSPGSTSRKDAAAPLRRVAVVATPRSGNAWLSHLVASAYALDGRGYAAPSEIPWASLPAEVVLNSHFLRDDAIERTLRERGFRVVVTTRHALDTLISILQLAKHEPATNRWLDGAGGDETGIVGAAPTSEAFLRYATGPRSRALLSVSRQWWDSGAPRTRYEDLIASAETELEKLVRALGWEPRATVADAVAANTIERLRSQTADDYHFWQGRPGLWRTLLPASVAESIAEANRESFDLFGYPCDPDPHLTAADAEANWRQLELQAALRSADANREKLAAANTRVDELTAALAAADGRIEQLSTQLAELSAQLGRYAGLRPRHLAIARWAERASRPLRRRSRLGPADGG